jgi:precorrin-6A/cobalt-precorrin-6A reductase
MRVLILGGTTEASAIARALAGDARFAPVLSLAGRTRAPMAQPVPVRVGGFGGAKGLSVYLRAERVEALIDATHPFAARIKANAAAAADAAGVRRLTVLRPPWQPGPGDDWRHVGTMAAAFAALGNIPRLVFLTVGQQDLAPFGPPHRYLIRSVDPPDLSGFAAPVETITARGPFDEAAEIALMRTRGIDMLVTKNSGGAATAAKLAAARTLRLPVVMVARPPPPPGETVETAEQALAWLHHQAGTAKARGV